MFGCPHRSSAGGGQCPSASRAATVLTPARHGPWRSPPGPGGRPLSPRCPPRCSRVPACWPPPPGCQASAQVWACLPLQPLLWWGPLEVGRVGLRPCGSGASGGAASDLGAAGEGLGARGPRPPASLELLCHTHRIAGGSWLFLTPGHPCQGHPAAPGARRRGWQCCSSRVSPGQAGPADPEAGGPRTAVRAGAGLPPVGLSLPGGHRVRRVGPSVGSVGSRLRGVPSEPASRLCPQSCLEFSLRIQEFIELVRQNKRLDAVRCAAGGPAVPGVGPGPGPSVRVPGHADCQALGGGPEGGRQEAANSAFPRGKCCGPSSQERPHAPGPPPGPSVRGPVAGPPLRAWEGAVKACGASRASWARPWGRPGGPGSSMGTQAGCPQQRVVGGTCEGGVPW